MDKNKIIEAAAKLVAKGAYDKAIKEYQKVLDGDPRDVRVLQKMGELYQKKNDNIQAAYYFTKVAESYSQDGFFLKAVALYKQVLKLNPNLVDVNLKLAELHQQLGLMSEAMAYYQIVANHHDKQGDTKASLDTLKKMVDLDPDNVASRIKLAELYARDSMQQEALDEFKRAAEYLKRNNRSDDYMRVAERISSLEPDNLQLAKDLAQGFLQKGDQKRALAKLQICFKADSKDIETLTLLAQAFQGLGQTSKTISVYKELAKVYSDKGQPQDEQKTWEKVRALDPNDPELAQRSGRPSRTPAPAPMPAARAPTRATATPVPRAATPSPAPRPAPRSLAAAPPSATMPAAPAAGPGGVPQPARQAPAPSGGGGGRDQLAKLLTETDVYVKYGLHDKALEHLRKVFAIDPENLDAHEKAYHIYLGSNNQAQAQDQLLNVLRLCTRRREVQRAQPYLATILQQNPGHPEVPAFLAVLRTDATQPVPVTASPGDEEAILVDSNEEEIIVADAPEDALAHASDDMALRAAGAAGEEEEVLHDDGLMPADETGPGDQPALDDEPISTQDDAAELMLESEEEEEPITSSFQLAPQEPATLDDSQSSPEVDEEPRTQMAPALNTEPNYKRQPVGARANPELTQPNIRVPRPEPKTLTNPRAAPFDVASAKQVTAERSGAAIEGPTRIEAFPMERPGRAATAQKEAPKPAAPQRPPTRAQARAPEPEPEPEAELMELEPEPDSALTPLPEPDFPEPDSTPTPLPTPMEQATMEEPAAEECDEAAFFVDQGLWDEAREILETVLVAYPGHARATELLARVEAGQGGADLSTGAIRTESEMPAVQLPDDQTGPKDAFDLAAELADELGGADGSSSNQDALGGDDFQYSVDEVFSEFKKGLEKVVKPEDAETHYDLGIAYKEMGLLDDAIGEMVMAQKGCLGKKKEVDCLMMAGVLYGMKGDHANAVERFKEGLSSEHAQPPSESFKALAYDLAAAYEALGKPGKALFWFQKIAKAEPKYRDVAAAVSRLSGSAKPEEDALPPRRNGVANGANGVHGKTPSGSSAQAGSGSPKPTDPGKARKVGYV
ncbi:MAG TPA: tetratricopeptide repeat protein [Myxococcaceae bacterium]|nr:tetratricopeptide repeat protein [Myxococcaceae bacterium]